MRVRHLLHFCWLFLQVPGETQGEAAPAAKKTVETVKAVSSRHAFKVTKDAVVHCSVSDWLILVSFFTVPNHNLLQSS